MLSIAGRNQMLNNSGGDFISVHSAYPGDSGTNEISGGSPAYARISATFNTAAGGARTLASPIAHNIPASTTVRFLGRWSAATAGTFLGCVANGGSEKDFTVVTATDVITSIGHGYSDAQTVVFINGTPPGGVSEGQVVFVRDATTDTLKCAATAGGAAYDLTSQPAASCKISKITEEIFAAQGTLSTTTFTQNLNT